MSCKDKVSSRYDRWSFCYDIVDNFPLISRPQRRWKGEAIEALGLKGKEKVLDVGTGSGHILPKIAERLSDGEVLGTDISKNMVKVARERINDQGCEENAYAVIDDIENSSFQDEEFDRILATFTFTTIPDPNSAAEECRRILKPGGKLVVLDTGNPDGLLAKTLFQPMKYSAKVFGRTHMDRNIQGILENKFSVNEIERNLLGMVYLLVCEKR